MKAPVNLYIVRQRKPEWLAVIVAATGSEQALELIRDVGLEDWRFGTTITRRIMRNIEEEPGVVTAVCLHARSDFRGITGRSKEAANRKRQRKNDLALARAHWVNGLPQEGKTG